MATARWAWLKSPRTREGARWSFASMSRATRRIRRAPARTFAALLSDVDPVVLPSSRSSTACGAAARARRRRARHADARARRAATTAGRRRHAERAGSRGRRSGDRRLHIARQARPRRMTETRRNRDYRPEVERLFAAPDRGRRHAAVAGRRGGRRDRRSGVGRADSAEPRAERGHAIRGAVSRSRSIAARRSFAR